MSFKTPVEVEENNKRKGEILENTEMITGEETEKPTDSAKVIKRTHRGSGGTAAKRKKKIDYYSQPKNALMQLNEIKPGLKYIVESEEGPPHDPVFVASVEVNGEKFIGKGHSKQLAKHAAAEAALQSFVQFRNMSEAVSSLSRGREAAYIDFTDDNAVVENSTFGQCEQSKITGGIHIGNSSLVGQNKMNSKLRKIITEADKKSPVMLLNELKPGLVYNLTKENTLSTDQRFVMTVLVDGEQFEGAGQNKKSAKAAVARAVLSQKYRVNFNAYTVLLDDSDMALFDLPQILADKIGKLLHDTVDKVASGIKECPKWKVLAGVVMTKDEAMEDMEVICFGTGTKSLKGENMSVNGTVLNDCHAEVIARRCLKDFFFTQLELHLNDCADQSVFEKALDGKFKLKPNHKFHFYVTAAPCGDAGIFSVHDEDIVAELNIERQVHRSGVLRTKLESGNGTLPVEQKTADVKKQTVECQIMSCSDKITTWNVLGVQGSLLNYFMDPVYFHTVIIGQLFHRNHMVHAMFKRIESALGELPPPFALHKPKMACTSTWATRHLVQPPQVSINWTCGLATPEFVMAKTGIPLHSQVSRLAKQSFFKRFNKIYDVTLKAPIPPQSQHYGAVKKASPNYPQAKEIVLKAFAFNGLGIWRRKPAEQEWFDLRTN